MVTNQSTSWALIGLELNLSVWNRIRWGAMARQLRAIASRVGDGAD